MCKLLITDSNIGNKFLDDMDVGVSDTDENFDHNIGLSPHSSDVEELHAPSSPQATPDSPVALEKSHNKMSTHDDCNRRSARNTGDGECRKGGNVHIPIVKPNVDRSLSIRSSGSSASTLDLSQLQSLVCEMKEGFVIAMHTLAQIQYGDQVLEEKVENNKVQYDNQLADVLKMVVNLKGELGSVLSQLHAATSNQQNLQSQVECLHYERDILLQELEKAGVISSQVREKYDSGKKDLKMKHATSLTTLLEKSSHNSRHQHYQHLIHSPRSGQQGNQSLQQQQPNGSNNSIHVTSDHDSGVNSAVPGDSCDDSPTTATSTIPPIVQSFIANLTNTPATVPEEDGASECSITVAANHSLDLSRSLIDELDDFGVNENENIEDLSKLKLDNEGEIKVKDAPDKPKTTPEETKVADFKTVDTPKKLAPHERSAKDFNRLRVARELLDTEKKYCSCLWTLLDHFARQLKEKAILAMSDISEMFPPCLANMYDHHCALLQALEQRLANCKYQCVLGDILFKFIQDSKCELLNQYQIYMKLFPHAMQAIKETARTNTNFRMFLKDCQKDPCCEGLDVSAFLLTPIQRIPRYVLILKQMLRCTEVDHPDHYYIETSLQYLGSFLTQLNNSIQSSLNEVNEFKKPKRRFSILPSFRLSSTSSVNSSQPESTSLASKRGDYMNNSVLMNHTIRPSQETIYGSKSSHNYYANESLIASEDVSLIQDSTGRLVPVKSKKVKGRRCKRDTSSNRTDGGRSSSLSHSASFHSSQSESNFGTEQSFVINRNGKTTDKTSNYRRAYSAAEDILSDSSFYTTSQSNSTICFDPTNRGQPQQLKNCYNKKLRYMCKNNQDLQPLFPKPPPEFCTDTSTPNAYGLKSHSAIHFRAQEGVYGENDSDVEADISSSTNAASMHSPIYYRQVVGTQAKNHRNNFKSQSCIDVNEGITEANNKQQCVMQEQINVALARSLTFKDGCYQSQKNGNMQGQRSLESDNVTELGDRSLRDIGRTKSELLSSSEQDWTLLNAPKANTINSSSKSKAIVQGISHKEIKKKAGTSRHLHSKSATDLNESSIKKKPSLKQSIKNIFFRKRNSKVTRQGSATGKLKQQTKRVPPSVCITQNGVFPTTASHSLNHTYHMVNSDTFKTVSKLSPSNLHNNTVTYIANSSHLEGSDEAFKSPPARLNATLPTHLEAEQTLQFHTGVNQHQERIAILIEGDNEEPCSAV